jgi:aspartokinase
VRFLDVSAADAPGTQVVAERGAGGPVGLAARRRLARVTFTGPLADLAASLARHALEPASLRTSGPRIELLLAPGPATDGLLAEIGREAHVEKDLALVALVGRAPAGSRAPGARALEVLAELGVPVREAQIGPDRASQVFLVGAADLERAVRGLHAALLSPRAAPVP